MANPDSSAALQATVLDRSNDSPTDLLYRAAVGPISADYYLPLLARFETTGRVHLSWNWAACLYTLNWMAFRSLWVAALTYIGVMLFLPLLAFGIGRLVLQLSEATEMMLLVVWGILSFVVPGVLGNAMLRSDLRKRMARAITDSKTLLEACAILAARASSRRRLVGLGVVNLILMGAAAGLYLAVPREGALAGIGPDPSPARIAESRPVIDLTTPPARAAASFPAPMAMPASEPLPAVALAPASAPLAVAPASAPQANPAVPPASDPPVAVTSPKPASAVSAAPKVLKPYFVNVGLFAQEANARKAQTTLQEAGLRPVAQEIGSGQSKRTRLRAGPFDTRAQAEAAAQKIRALKLEAQVAQP